MISHGFCHLVSTVTNNRKLFGSPYILGVSEWHPTVSFCVRRASARTLKLTGENLPPPLPLPPLPSQWMRLSEVVPGLDMNSQVQSQSLLAALCLYLTISWLCPSLQGEGRLTGPQHGQCFRFEKPTSVKFMQGCISNIFHFFFLKKVKEEETYRGGS